MSEPKNANGGPRTIYARNDEWDSWKYRAWQSRVSVSEYIRKAVEAYSSGSRNEAGPETDAVRLGGSVRGKRGKGDGGARLVVGGIQQEDGSGAAHPPRHMQRAVHRNAIIGREDRERAPYASAPTPSTKVAKDHRDRFAVGNDLGPCGNTSCRNRASQEHYPFCSTGCRK